MQFYQAFADLCLDNISDSNIREVVLLSHGCRWSSTSYTMEQYKTVESHILFKLRTVQGQPNLHKKSDKFRSASLTLRRAEPSNDLDMHNYIETVPGCTKLQRNLFTEQLQQNSSLFQNRMTERHELLAWH